MAPAAVVPTIVPLIFSKHICVVPKQPPSNVFTHFSVLEKVIVSIVDVPVIPYTTEWDANGFGVANSTIVDYHVH